MQLLYNSDCVTSARTLRGLCQDLASKVLLQMYMIMWIFGVLSQSLYQLGQTFFYFVYTKTIKCLITDKFYFKT